LQKKFIQEITKAIAKPKLTKSPTKEADSRNPIDYEFFAKAIVLEWSTSILIPIAIPKRIQLQQNSGGVETAKRFK